MKLKNAGFRNNILLIVSSLILWSIISGNIVVYAFEKNIPDSCFERAKSVSGDRPDSPRLVDFDCSSASDLQILGGDVLKSLDAQFMHHVQALRQEYSLSGEKITIGIWDAGKVLSTHIQFDDRITFGDLDEEYFNFQKVPIHEHATHVAGTVGSSGKKQIMAQGMAPRVNVISYYWKDDLEELIESVDNGVSVTNHSYGVPGGWSYGGRGKCDENWTWLGRVEDSIDVRFGLYEKKSEKLDEIIYKNPTLSIFVAAGNERGFDADPSAFKNDPRDYVIFTGSHCVWQDDKWKESKNFRKCDNHKEGYDTLTGTALSKNVITIGAASDLPREFDLTKFEVTDFSSMGPTDDGRVKPDVVANGDQLYSTYIPKRCLRSKGRLCYVSDIKESEKFLFERNSGTSMACPVASGIGALLNELAVRKLNRTLFADEMKAALIHTAISPTGDGAPTYSYGWGLIHALNAGNLVAGEMGSLSRHQILKDRTNQFNKSIEWTAQDEKLRVTIVWLDPPGKSLGNQNAIIDNRESVVINDLSFKLISPTGKTYYPWSLDPDHPKKRATQENNVENRIPDNVKRIDVNKEHWEPGQWKLIGDLTGLKSKTVSMTIAVSDGAIMR